MLTIALWIHLCSMAMLVGGMTFVFFALRPALSRQAEDPAVKGVSSFVRTRFRLIAILLTGVIVASGIVNIIVAPPRRWYIVVLIIKVLLAAGILYLYFRNAFAKAPTFRLPEPSAPPPDAPAETTPAKEATEWKSAWLRAPTASQVKMELMLIGGALVVILLGVVLALS